MNIDLKKYGISIIFLYDLSINVEIKKNINYNKRLGEILDPDLDVYTGSESCMLEAQDPDLSYLSTPGSGPWMPGSTMLSFFMANLTLAGNFTNHKTEQTKLQIPIVNTQNGSC